MRIFEVPPWIVLSLLFRNTKDDLSYRYQPDLSPFTTAQSQSQTLSPRPMISRLQLDKVLAHSDNGIAGFSQCILLANTDPWATTEWDVAPAWPQGTIRGLGAPSFRNKLFGCGSKDVMTTVESVDGIDDDRALGHENRGCA